MHHQDRSQHLPGCNRNLQQSSNRQGEGGRLEEDPRTIVEADVGAMGLVQVREDVASERQVLGHDQVPITPAIPEHGLDLRVGKVLEDLPQESELRGRKIIRQEVRATELDIRELLPVPFDEWSHNVDSYVPWHAGATSFLPTRKSPQPRSTTERTPCSAMKAFTIAT